MTSRYDRLIADDLSKARAACDRKDNNTSFSILCATLDKVLASRSDVVTGAALSANPVPVEGLKIVRTETGLKARKPGDPPGSSQCAILINYIAAFAAALPAKSLAERLEVEVRQRSQVCMSSDADLPVKRRRLWLLTGMWMWLLQRQPGTQRLLQKHQFLLAHLLHEPESYIRTLWREHMFWFYFNYAKRLVHLDNRAESTRYLSGFFWPDKDDYRRLIQNSNSASRVLLSIHMGDFYGAFREISSLSGPGRNAISLRRETSVNHGMQHFSADRISHRVLYHHQYQPGIIVSALRRGNHTLATLFDLRDDFGSTVVVDFFGHRARFVKGPAQLAILGRSPIFPFVCFENQGRNCIEMAPVIDTRLRPGESLHQGTVRITQTLVSLAERWIRRWPSQWKYLTALPAYFEAAS